MTRRNADVLELVEGFKRLPCHARPIPGESVSDWMARIDRYLWTVIVPGSADGQRSADDWLDEIRRELNE